MRGNYAKEGVVSVWVGSFSDEHSLREYTDFEYDEHRGARCPFADDFRLGWFHEGQRRYTHVGGGLPMSMQIFAGHPHSSSFAPAALAAMRGVAANSLILIYDLEYGEKALGGLPGPRPPLRFVGAYPYDEKARPVARLDSPYATLERFLDHWDGVRMVTLKLLHCFGDEDLRRSLWPGSRTAGELFHHVGAHQFYAARGLLRGQWEPSGTLEESPDADWDLHKHLTVYGIETLHHWLESVQHRVRGWAEEVAESRLADFAADNPWHEGMRGWLLLQHAYQDELHHRGQLYLFARQLGHLPPDVFAADHPDYWEQRKWK